MTRSRVGGADYTAMNAKDQTGETPTDFRRAIAAAEQDYPGTSYYPNWSKWFGYYRDVAELQAVINTKATYTIGRGYKAEERVKKLLDSIRGFGKDTFNNIMWNMIVCYTAGGDSFAEIIRDKKGRLRNIKPINPGSMVIHTTPKGIIEKYSQCVSYSGKYKYVDFRPEDIFHLPWNRIGDEPHGRSTIEKLQWLVDARNEAQKDIRIVFHRYVKPLLITEADTDDEEEIAALKIKLDKAVELMENLIIPKGTVSVERVSIPQYSTLDPLPWLKFLQTYFIMAEGVPEVVLGFGQETTEASSKILWLGWQQNVDNNQRFLEEQIKAQLKLDVEYDPPADLEPAMKEDVRKERNIDNLDEN